MGIWNFRSLLLAAIVLNSCITWTASRHHFTHNVSGQRSRHRRQGAGLYLPASFVIPDGEGSGAWGEWGEVSPCSRTCGGGVASQKRICLQVGANGEPLCTGGDTKYFSCSTQDCPEGSMDFRAEQCAEFNDKLFKDVKYNWIPYTRGMNPCELNCRPRGERFYYRHRQKVIDGTRCNDEDINVCVNGECQSVGCDMMLGSTSREDKCRVCRGNGTDCHTVKGLLDSQDLIKGYNDVLLIPDGATSIYIAEVRPSNNYLALRSKFNNVYYLNGDYHIDFPRPLLIAGAIWHYERNQLGFNAPDVLRSQGPITEPLYLSLLLQGENVGIEYEYSIPRRLAPPVKQKYHWAMSEFSNCSATCGGGQQTLNVSCVGDEELNVVADSLCDKDLKPSSQQSCNQVACPPQWIEEPWSPCSKRCGEGGTQSRKVPCQKTTADGVPSLVPDDECLDLLGPKPETSRECNKDTICPTWFTGPWKHCDKFCDEGKQTRQVVCHKRVKGRVEILPDEDCEEEKPAAEQTCILQLCDGVDWVLTDWIGCDTCSSTVRTRTAVCAVNTRKVVDDSFCSHHELPPLEEACDPTKLPNCTTQWYATQWGKCSVECGKGIQSRLLFCGEFDGAGVKKVEDSLCDLKTKYNTTKPCEVPPEDCPAKWFAGPWNECDKKCGGGAQDRQVMCLIGDKESTKCDPSSILDSTQSCNVGSCNEDDVIPINSSSTPIMDEDSEDCEIEEYPEVGAAEIDLTTTPDVTPTENDEGSGTSTTFTEITTDEGSGEGETIEDSYSTTDSGVNNKTGNPYTRPPYKTETDNIFETEISGLEDSTDITSTEYDATSSQYTDSTEGNTASTEYNYSTEDDSTIGTSYDYNSSGDLYTFSESTEEVTKNTDTESKTTTDSSQSTDSNSTATVTTESSVGTNTDGADATNDNKSEITITTDNIQTTDVNQTDTTQATESTTDETTNSDSTDTTLTTESTITENTESDSTDTTQTTESTATENTESDSTDTTQTTESTTTENTESDSTDTTQTTESTTTENTESDSTDKTQTTESTTTEITESDSTDTTMSTTEMGSTIASSTETADKNITEGVESETSKEETESVVTYKTTLEMNTTESTSAASYYETESSTAEDKSEPTTTTEIIVESTTINIEVTGGTTESGATISELITTTEISADSNTTEPAESASTTESSTTELESTNTTEGIESTTTEISEAVSTEMTESTQSTSTEMGSTTTETTDTNITDAMEGTSESGATDSGSTTPWTWESTVESVTRKGIKACKVKRKPPCNKTKFGCCPDGRTIATGPFDKGCPKTCHNTKFGCCPDGVLAAIGPDKQGCIEPCNETLFGCCLSDNITAAQGNDQEGCPPPPPPCKSSQFGCCSDNETEAAGPNKEGCYPTEITESTTVSETGSTTEDNECEEGTCTTEMQTTEQLSTTVTETVVTSTTGSQCSTLEFGCCADGEAPAHGPEGEGCCANTPFGCCPDNFKPADGPHLEGCGCENSHYGCCPDNETIARGPHNEGCGCQFTTYGCCPDRHTEALGPNYEGCGCHTYQFGCCPDGTRAAKGPRYQGCRCEESKFGCCGDGQTAAVGPDMLGCDCASSRYGCCPDGKTAAEGRKFQGCTDVPEDRQAGCSLPIDRGSCRNYTVQWYFEPGYGGCSRFWYGGCEGNGNRFSSEDECKDVCVNPPPKDACKLPKIKGSCTGDHRRWYYDSTSEQCLQFIYGGCLGNANNFETREACKEQCEPPKPTDQCELAIDAGPCAGTFGRWGFNTESKRCEQFIWGGCEGNINRFNSEAACIQRCSPTGVQKAECSLPKEVGNCTDKQAMWTYKEARCMPFYYTGCGGNENRFDSEEACVEACPTPYEPDVCTLPAEVGDCSDYRLKWYYDTAELRCRQFYYGGCGGNGNSFDTEEECEYRCSPQVIPTTIKTTTTQTPFSTEDCFSKIDRGPCNDVEERWAYDAALGACTRFEYGGCQGNRNNFPTLDHCQFLCHAAQDICQLPMRSGPCDDSQMKWFYDKTTDTCSRFTYSGCDGNDNRFETEDDCERRCRGGPAAPEPTRSTLTPPTAPTVFIPLQCRISPTLEPCQDAGEVWFLDIYTRECTSFMNAAEGEACRRTGVFPSREDCEYACAEFPDFVTRPTSMPIAKEQDVCTLPAEVGDCANYTLKWSYDTTQRRCRQFYYGGCGGNGNSFDTEQECQNRCSPQAVTTTLSTTTVQEVFGTEPDVCTLPSEAGDCDNWTLKWYYDSEKQRCLQFYYGGCGGNGNSFITEQECQNRCSPQAVTTTLSTTAEEVFGTDACQQTPDPGTCYGYFIKWYYDRARDICNQFVFTGCGGNNNRFETIDACEGRCRQRFPQTTSTVESLTSITPLTELPPVVQDECRTPESLSPCGRNITAYYYDSESRVCRASSIGDCNYRNRYRSEEECERRCGQFVGRDVCGSHLDPGPCHEQVVKYYWDKLTGSCLRYTYGGCDGGPNRFSTAEECEEICGPRDSACKQHLEPGSSECGAPASRRWYYSTDRGICLAFIYKGCEGNQNNFITPELCASTCNEVLPDCDRYNEECENIRCEFGVQRMRTAEGCESCSCVPVEVDCTPFKQDCAQLKCTYGIIRTTGADGCERCTCIDHPCANTDCPEGEKCVPIASSDSVTNEIRYSAVCRTVNKRGICPPKGGLNQTNCRTECYDDADCHGTSKCCSRGCSFLCLEPFTLTTLAPFTTHLPGPHAPEPNIEETEPEVTAHEGGKATLRCLFHSNPPPKITWRRGEITIDGDIDRYRLLSDGTLEIVSLYRNDSGVYICVADNGLGVAEQEVHLQVDDPVELQAGISGEQNAVVEGTYGGSITIRCHAYGYPEPSVNWYRGLTGSMVPYYSNLYEARGNVLLIKELNQETLGEYACQAYNGIGKPASWTVTVQARQDNFVPIQPPRLVIVTPRRPQTETTVKVTTEPPLPVIPVVTRYTVPVSVRLVAEQTTVPAGSQLNLQCQADGYPEPTVYWNKDGFRFANSDRIQIYGARLTITNVNINDNGVYECSAKNEYTSDSKSERITVEGLFIPSYCSDNPLFANCKLIVRSKFCTHKYYSTFCCKSCAEAGQLNPQDLLRMQADQPFSKRK